MYIENMATPNVCPAPLAMKSSAMSVSLCLAKCINVTQSVTMNWRLVAWLGSPRRAINPIRRRRSVKTERCSSVTLANSTLPTTWKVLWESTNPRESVFVANTWQHLPHLLFCGPLVSNFLTELFCKQSPVYAVFWPLLPHPSTDRNETRTWSSLSP